LTGFVLTAKKFILGSSQKLFYAAVVYDAPTAAAAVVGGGAGASKLRCRSIKSRKQNSGTSKQRTSPER